MSDVTDLERFDEALRSIRVRNAAFEMYLAGYDQRVEDEKTQPSSLRDVHGFNKHLRENFDREWENVRASLEEEQ